MMNKMILSLTCWILGQGSEKCFTENIGETYKDDSGIVIEFSEFTVSNFKEKLFRRGEVKDIVRNTGEMDLWKVDGKKVDEEENNLKKFTVSDIKEKLGGEKMFPRFPLENYFKAKEIGTRDIHVFIVCTIVTPATGPNVGPSRSLEEVLFMILQDIHTENIQETKLDLDMPLKDRDTKEALRIFENNIHLCDKKDVPKSDFKFLACSGAAGIGKTRWGREFSNAVERDWTPPKEWTKDGEPHICYFLLDFVNGVRLDIPDQKLSASIILGLRIAYEYFARKKMSFKVFRQLARSIPQSSPDLFELNWVLNHIRNLLKLKPQQLLIVILHIDEYQEIFDFGWEIGKKGLFKELMLELGPLMTSSRGGYYVQTFLSGTAYQEVLRSAIPTGYSFESVKCPLLTLKAIFEIVDHFAVEDKQRHWITSSQFLQLLYDTGGLPRALQYVLTQFLVKRQNFFQRLQQERFDFDHIFVSIIEEIKNKYKLSNFVLEKPELSRQILYHCLGSIPVQLNSVLDRGFPDLTVEKMERNGFLILKKYDDLNYFIEMPFYFIYIFDTVLSIVPENIRKTFYPGSKMEWNSWENFVGEYEAFRNNIMVNLGKKEISLKELYRGAIGKDSILNTQIKLKKLDICMARSQFPKTFPLRNSDNKAVKSLDGLVVINGNSAQFADVFSERQTSNGEDIITGLQEKWYTTSKNLTIDDIKKEHDKNNNAFNLANNQKLKNKLENTRIVTVMFTSQLFEGNVNDMPDDCLVIARKNFEQYFGPLFSSRLIFDIVGELNLNYAEPQRIEAMIKDIGPETSRKICEKRPFYGVEDLLGKRWDKDCEARLKRCRTQLEQCSYAPYSFLENYSNSNIDDTDTEMVSVDDDE